MVPGLASGDGTAVTRRGDSDVRRWTWAGHRANAALAASLPSVVPRHRLLDDITRRSWRAAVADAGTGLTLPEVDPNAGYRRLQRSAAPGTRCGAATHRPGRPP
ncbi:hypothetical protein GCM10017779_03000 [Streptomyces capillispiralis]|nr:hypothetical protein GCM10017779_03000 [Streptomyces capillispiralis]